VGRGARGEISSGDEYKRVPLRGRCPRDPHPYPSHKGEGIMTCLAPPAIENRTNDAISGAKPQKRGKT
jgi:hypothetical protein